MTREATKYRIRWLLRTGMVALLLAARLTPAEFAPASFDGLVVGKATLTDARVKFGSPKTFFEDRAGSTWMYYEDIGVLPGKVEIVASSKTGIIDIISVMPKVFTLEMAKEVFGAQFRIARFDFDDCLAKGGEAPIFESPKGPLEFVLYDSLGIAISIGSSGMQIQYRKEPLGPPTSQCGTGRQE